MKKLLILFAFVLCSCASTKPLQYQASPLVKTDTTHHVLWEGMPARSTAPPPGGIYRLMIYVFVSVAVMGNIITGK